MTRLASHELFGLPFIKHENIAGNPREGMCVCHSCGTIDYYSWLYGIDHFPLVCRKCKARDIHIFGDGDEISDLDLFRFGNFADGIGEE
jgi:hypothetical protein